MIGRLNHIQNFYTSAANDLSGKALIILTTETPGRLLRLEWKSEISSLPGGGVRLFIANSRVIQDEEQWGRILNFLEVGTTAHWIFPIVASALAWRDEQSGEMRFSKGHIVSGIRGAHFLAHADKIIRAYMRGMPASFKRYLKTGALPG